MEALAAFLQYLVEELMTLPMQLLANEFYL